MQPEIHPNYLAVLVCVAANFVLGFLWYGPLFGKSWAKEMKFPPDFKPATSQMMQAMALMVVGAFMTAFVLAHSVEVWRPSTWKAGADAAGWTYGFFSALFTWFGFFVPILLGGVAWEGKSWKLFGINAAYHFVSLQIIGAILTHWR